MLVGVKLVFRTDPETIGRLRKDDRKRPVSMQEVNFYCHRSELAETEQAFPQDTPEPVDDFRNQRLRRLQNIAEMACRCKIVRG